jgi:hypothetical protein
MVVIVLVLVVVIAVGRVPVAVVQVVEMVVVRDDVVPSPLPVDVPVRLGQSMGARRQRLPGRAHRGEQHEDGDGE